MDEDFGLIRRMRGGDEDAVECFVRKYYPDILRYCQYHLSGNAEAEDITQETFAGFFRAFDRYRHYGKAKNYLYVIAGNLCRNFYKKRELLPLYELPAQTENPADAWDVRYDMELALGRLPEELREIVIMYYYQELKLKEIAQILQIGLPLVKYRLRAAKERLRHLLGEEGEYGTNER